MRCLYQEVAKIVAGARRRYGGEYLTIYENAIITYFETELTNMLAADNPSFDREKFRKACIDES